MGRRVIRDWKPERVEDATVAPHRYTWDSNSDYRDAESYAEFKAGVPYKEGEVVFVERYEKGAKVAKKARIVHMIPERDNCGFRRELFIAQFETKAGLWAKVGEKVYPGYIQRGYKIAGLAPDVKD